MTRCKDCFSVGKELYCSTKFDKAGSPLFCYGCSDFVARPEPSKTELQSILSDMNNNKRLTDDQWCLVIKALEELIQKER